MTFPTSTTNAVSPDLLARARSAYETRKHLGVVSNIFTGAQLEQLLFKRLEQMGFARADVVLLPYSVVVGSSDPVHCTFRLAGVADQNLTFQAVLDPETGHMTCLDMLYGGLEQGDIAELADIYEMLAAIDSLASMPE